VCCAAAGLFGNEERVRCPGVAGFRRKERLRQDRNIEKPWPEALRGV
jgi:hypothetical protein